MKMQDKILTLSIITATYQSAQHLPGLIASLQKQTCKDFQWVVADGNSSDETIELLNSVHGLNLNWQSEHDFGIYDALNKAIKRSASDYYLVVGSDDILADNAVETIVNEINKTDLELDVLVGQALANGKLYKRRPNHSWLYGAAAFVNTHSVGTVFKKSLHDKFGFYSNQYPILADSFFMKTIFQSNQIKVKYIDDVFGIFGTNGISNTAVLHTQVEYLQMQLITEKYSFLQILIFIARFLKYKLQ